VKKDDHVRRWSDGVIALLHQIVFILDETKKKDGKT
jgi:hypothetical protein